MADQNPTGEVGYLLSRKIDSIETRFETHTLKVEDRLDQLVDIMRQVAILQEREMNNTDTIREIKDGIRRAHERVDVLISQIDSQQSANKSLYSEKLEKETDKIDGEMDVIMKKISETDDTLKSWLNRGKGAWYIMIFTFGLIQLSGGYLFTQLSDKLENIEILTARNTNDIIHIKHEHEMLKLGNGGVQ